MKDSFLGSRWMAYIRKDIYENGRAYQLVSLVLVGIMTVFFVFVGIICNKGDYGNDRGDSAVLVELIFGLLMFFAVGCFSVSLMWKAMGRKEGRFALLTLPVSDAEKYLWRLLVHVVGAYLLCAVAFWVADVVRVGVVRLLYPDNLSIETFNLSYLIHQDDVHHTGLWNSSRDMFKTLSFFFCYQSFFALGAIVWPRLSFFKTFACTMLLFAVGITSVCVLGMLLLDDVSCYYPNIAWMRAHPVRMEFLLYLLLWGYALFNYVMGYFRLREAEIHHRL